jgi:hypothetical protein
MLTLKRLFFLTVLVGLTCAVVGAQVLRSRDYAILNPAVAVAPDGATFTLSFTVRNAGATAQNEAFIEVINLLNNALLSRDPLAPIGEGGSVTVSIPFSTEGFEAGVLPLEVRVGVDANEPAILQENNSVRISVTLPARNAPASPTPSPIPTGTPAPSLPTLDAQSLRAGIQRLAVALVGREISDEEILFAGIITLVVVLGLWLFSLILRLIFRREPSFDAWQPPYAIMPLMDSNTVEGRRQAWQQHAQNNLLLATPTPNSIHAIKQLLSVEGESLQGWQVVALRLSQYDAYGRVAKSQTLADSTAVRALNRALKARDKLSHEAFARRIATVAKRLMRAFRRKLNAKNAFLPVALDVRLQGKHGAVNIVFELYQFQGTAWVRLDQWQPSVPIISRTVQENLTFTAHGMTANERYNAFLQRLTDDIAWLLTEMLRARLPQKTGETALTHQYDVPDTLRGVKPVQ